MRPRGVRQRIQRLREHAEQQDRAHPQLASRRGLTRFIHGCAALGYCDAFAEVAADPQRKAGRDDEIAEPILLRIPPRTLMGRDTPDAYFPMACFNAAGSCLDGVLSHYRACPLITSLGHYEPAEERELLDMMRTPRVDYEDQPDNRADIAERITNQLRKTVRRFE